MKPQCNLIVDSTCDLPLEMVKDRTFDQLHFNYILNGVSKKDDFFQSMTPHEFYEALREGASASTSQAGPAEMDDVFTRAAEDGTPTVYLSFCDALSSEYSSACASRERVLEKYPDAPLYVVDTYLPSTPEGLLVLEAMHQREAGLTAEEMVAWVQEACYFTNTIFMVEDLDALHRGGRIPASVAVAGTKLKVKPMLSTDLKGGLTVMGAARGRNKGIKQMLDFFDKNREDKANPTTVLVGNADCPKDAEKLANDIRKLAPNANVIIHNIGLTIGSHVGAGMLSLSFWGKDRREQLSIADKIARRVKGE